MLQRLRERSSDERGFTFIELLVACLVIGILAGVAILSLLSQQGKAADAPAKALARAAQTTALTYVTENEGMSSGLTKQVLVRYEPTIQIAPGNNKPYVSSVEAIEGTAEEGFELTVTAPNGHTFTVKREGAGIKHTCTPEGKTGSAGGGCQNSTW